MVKNINEIKLETIHKLYSQMGYPIEDGINVCGIRGMDIEANTFDDVIIMFSDTVLHIAQATTDPGLTYRLDPINNKGTAILPMGFHKDIWSIGKHRGKYTTLVQRHPCRVIRDANKDTLLDYNIPADAVLDIKVDDKPTYWACTDKWDKGLKFDSNGTYKFVKGDESWVVEIGQFGINFHRARNSNNHADEVNKFSAGCQVTRKLDDHKHMIDLIINDSKDTYSYALFHEIML